MPTESPTISNRYNKDIRGNILDRYDSPTYNIKLYQIDFDSMLRNKLVGNTAVVFAQTGVTAGSQIDNVEITTRATPGRSFIPVTISFTIEQPGAADLIDRMQAAASMLGYPTDSENNPVFLEIMFRGWDTEVTNTSEVIRGPYRYKIELSRLSLSVTAVGSSYQFEGRFADHTGYDDVNFRIPLSKQTTGATIREHITDGTNGLEKIIRDHYTNFAASHLLPDQILFDLSDDSIADIIDANFNYVPGIADVLSRTVDPALDGLSADEIEEEVSQRNYVGSIRGRNTIFGDRVQLTARKDTTLEYYLFFMMAMIPGFQNQLTRHSDLTQPGLADNIANGHVKRLVVDVSTTYRDDFPENSTGSLRVRGYDPSRRTLAKIYTYRPRLVDCVGTEQVVNTSDNSCTPDQQLSRFNDITINKMYSYMFTGLNDQIIDVDISYNNGLAILVAPLHGFIGSSQMLSSYSSGLPFNSTSDDIPLTSEHVREAVVAAEAVDATTESSSSATNNEYNIDDFDMTLYNARVVPHYRNDVSNPLGAESAEQLSTVGTGTILSYIYQNNREASFLVNLELSLRGDPYYMGPISGNDATKELSEEYSVPENIIHGGGTPHFIFEMQLPRQYDTDNDNEDNNTGLWEPAGKAYFMSGVYLVREVTNTFSGGMFTSKIKGPKVEAIDLSIIDQADISSTSTEQQDPPQVLSSSSPTSDRPSESLDPFDTSSDRPVGNNPDFGNASAPVNSRNNNPGNIRISNSAWQGKIGDDGSFEVFATQEQGARAQMINMRSQINKDGNNATIDTLISRWAPSTENNTTAYINAVYADTGIPRGQRIDPYNQSQMASIARAIARREGGPTAIPDDWQSITFWNQAYRDANG